MIRKNQDGAGFLSSLNGDQSPLLMLCLAGFLAPLIGGTVSVDSVSLEPGYSPLMKAIFGGSEVPILSHFVLSLLVCGAAFWTLVKRRVIQVPMPYVSLIWIAFFAIVGASTIFSAFLFSSVPAALEWIVYGIAAFAAVAIVGRKSGPKTLTLFLFAGCVLLALIGVYEYRFGTTDPNWRIFATWQNPNALAGMLLVGFFLGLGLCVEAVKSRLAWMVAATALIGYALALTQSKGAFLAALVGLVVFVLAFLLWKSKELSTLRSLGAVAAILVAVIGLLFILRLKSPEGITAGSPVARIANAGETQEQSSGFRILLWKSAVELIKLRPFGWGIGAYRFESARPGLTTQTHFAHNSYLQLGAESGLLSVLILLGLGGVWLTLFLRGSRKHSPETAGLRAGLLASIVAIGAHSFVDSDLHYFGLGLVFFTLIGIGLQLCADGVTPESILPSPRWSALAVCIVIPLALLYFGGIEATKTHIRANLEKGRYDEAAAGAAAVTKWAPGDGESWYLSAVVAADPDARTTAMQKAAESAPSTKNLRAVARAKSEGEFSAEAVTYLNRALERDPNNLLTLLALMEIWIEAKNDAEASKTAQRLVDVEKTSVYQTRALPELVPTETFYARKYLADRTEEPAKKVELLRPAYEGLVEYAKRTVPNIVSATSAGVPSFAGESPRDAKQKMGLAKEIAEDLISAYRAVGESGKAVEVESGAAAFDDALAGLG